MGEPRVHAAAPSASVPGRRTFRRHVKSALAIAAEAGAYSVGFEGVRGVLPGFTVYLSGEFCGAGGRAPHAAAFRAAAPPSDRRRTGGLAQPGARDAARVDAPAQPAARRARGCRAGARVQQRRQGVSERLAHSATTATAAAPLEGSAKAALPRVETRVAILEPTAPHDPPPHTNHTLSPCAPAYVPSYAPPPPSSHNSTSHPQEEDDPLSYPPDLRHLLPHARFSYEEQRWDYYVTYGGPDYKRRSSSKKRAEPPSPPWPPPSAIVGCVVNERQHPRASPPPPPPPRLPPARRH